MLILRIARWRFQPAFTDEQPLAPGASVFLEETGWLPPVPWRAAPGRLAWHEEAALPLSPPDDSAWSPPRPWTLHPRVPGWGQEDVLPGRLDEHGWLPPPPWVARPVVALLADDEWVSPPAVVPLSDDGWQPPPPWAVAAGQAVLVEEDWVSPPAPVPLTEDAWQPPRPWPAWQMGLTAGEAQAMVPLVPGDEDPYQPPPPWPVPARQAMLDDGTGPGVAPPPLGGDDAGWQPPRRWDLHAVPLVWGTEDLLPRLSVDEDAWDAPPPWAVPWRRMLAWADEAWTGGAVPPPDDAAWQPPRPWRGTPPRLVWDDDESALAPGAYFCLEDEPYRPPRPWPVPPRQAWGVLDEWVVFVPSALPDDAWLAPRPWPVPQRHAVIDDAAWTPPPYYGFQRGYVTGTLTAIPGASLLTLSGLVPLGYRVLGVSSTILEAFGTSGGLAALLLGDGVLEDRWGRQGTLTLGAQTLQKDVRSATQPIAAPSGYALLVAAEGGLFDGSGDLHVTIFWERLAADVP